MPANYPQMLRPVLCGGPFPCRAQIKRCNSEMSRSADGRLPLDQEASITATRTLQTPYQATEAHTAMPTEISPLPMREVQPVSSPQLRKQVLKLVLLPLSLRRHEGTDQTMHSQLQNTATAVIKAVVMYSKTSVCMFQLCNPENSSRSFMNTGRCEQSLSGSTFFRRGHRLFS